MKWQRELLPVLVVLSAVSACTENQSSPEKVNTSINSSGSSVQTKSPADNKIDWPEKIEPTSVDMQLIKVSENCYYVQGPPGTPTDNDGFMSNAGVVITTDGVVVFDSLGTPSLAYKLYSLIKAVTDKPVKKVIVSHYHADHIYGLQVFKEQGAEIIAPDGARAYVNSPAADQRLKERRESLFPWVDENTYIVEPDKYISEDNEFTLGNVTIKLMLLGSTHSQGDLMMRVAPDAVLFSGDLIFEGRIPFVAGSNPENWLSRLTALETRGLKEIIPGHGPAPAIPGEAVNYTKAYLQVLHDSMGGAVENLTPFDEAYANTDWSVYENEPAFRVNRMNAYFVYLRLEAKSMQ